MAKPRVSILQESGVRFLARSGSDAYAVLVSFVVSLTLYGLRAGWTGERDFTTADMLVVICVYFATSWLIEHGGWQRIGAALHEDRDGVESNQAPLALSINVSSSIKVESHLVVQVGATNASVAISPTSDTVIIVTSLTGEEVLQAIRVSSMEKFEPVARNATRRPQVLVLNEA